MADIAVTRFALTTAAAGNTQDITISGFGTPSAVMFFYSGDSTDDSINTASNRSGMGLTDGTTQYATSNRCENAVASAVGLRREALTTNCIIVCSNTTTTTQARFGFSSWVTDGIRLVVNLQATGAFNVTAVFFSADFTSKVHIEDLGNTLTVQNITAIGFQPDVVFAVGNGGSASASSNFYAPSIGVAVNSGGISQYGVLATQNAGVSTTEVITRAANTSIGGQVGGYTATLSDFDSSGFSVTTSATAGADDLIFLALKLPAGHQAKVFDASVPTSGNIAVTSPGFTPYFGMMGLMAGPTAYDTDTSTGGMGFSIAALDATTMSSASWSSTDAVTTTVEKGITAPSFKLLKEDGTAETTSSGYAFDSQGWDITLTANPAAAVLGFGLAIGDASSGFSVTDVDLDETIVDGQTGVVVTITGAVSATGKKVYITQGANSVEQTVTAEDATSATITVSFGGVLTAGAATLSVRNPL